MSRSKFPKTNQLGLHLGRTKDANEVDYRLNSPFNRSVPLNVMMVVVIVGLSWVGLTSVFDAIDMWQNVDRLFSLTAALFQTFWSIGWMFATIVISIVCLAVAFGRLVVLVYAGRIDFIIGVPGLGARLSFNAHDVKKISLVPYSESSLFAKGGMQLKIHTDGDHDNSPIGSNMTQAAADKLWSAIQRNKHIISDLDGGLDRATEAAQRKGIVPINLVSTAASDALSNKIRFNADKAVTLTSSSTILLVLANLVPIVGVLYLG